MKISADEYFGDILNPDSIFRLDTPEKRLYAAIISRAVQDLTGRKRQLGSIGRKFNVDPKDRRSAQEYIFDAPDNFWHDCCAISDSPEVAFGYIRKFILAQSEN